jgi:hypothetical protein
VIAAILVLVRFMFWPSNTSMNYLCNALTAFRLPQRVLETYGLLLPDAYVQYDESEAPFCVKPSWDELNADIERARNQNSIQLREVCEELLRRRNDEQWYASNFVEDAARFQDYMAKLKVQLTADGYKFDGFAIHATLRARPVVELADQALRTALEQLTFPLANEVKENLASAEQHFEEPDYNGALQNLRLALKFTLEGVARALESQTGKRLPSERENEVRDYLESVGFLSREEKNGLAGIYGLLSIRPHGRANEKSALLSYAACIMACFYAVDKFGTRA